MYAKEYSVLQQHNYNNITTYKFSIVIYIVPPLKRALSSLMRKFQSEHPRKKIARTHTHIYACKQMNTTIPPQRLYDCNWSRSEYSTGFTYDLQPGKYLECFLTASLWLCMRDLSSCERKLFPLPDGEITQTNCLS